jgi:hypothetical protein
MIDRKKNENLTTKNKIALRSFYVITAITLTRSLIHLFAPDGGAQSIATIPLDAFPPEAAAVVIHLFGLWGLSQLLLGLVYLYACVRARHLIPMLYLLAILEYSMRIALTFIKPMEVSKTAPGGVANYVVVPVFIILFFLAKGMEKQTGSMA